MVVNFGNDSVHFVILLRTFRLQPSAPPQQFLQVATPSTPSGAPLAYAALRGAPSPFKSS
jgi:hypothetical protein